MQNKAKGRLKVATAELFKDRKAFNIGQKNCQQQPRTETRFNILTHERRQDNEILFSSFIIVSLMPQYCRLAGKSEAIIFFSKTRKCPKRTQSYYLSTRAPVKRLKRFAKKQHHLNRFTNWSNSHIFPAGRKNRVKYICSAAERLFLFWWLLWWLYQITWLEMMRLESWDKQHCSWWDVMSKAPDVE